MAVVGYIDEWDINGEEYEIHDKERGLPNGVATLDSNGRIPYSQLPESAIELKGYWDADTNTPELADGTGTNGDEYIVSVAGSQDLGSGEQYFGVGDRVLYTSNIWKNITSGFTKSVSEIPSDAQGNVDLTRQNDITKLLSKDLIAKYLVPLGSNWEKVSQIFTPTSSLNTSIYSAFCRVNSLFFLGVNGGNTTQNTYISVDEGETFTLLVTYYSIQNIVYIESTQTYMGVFTHYNYSTSKYSVEVHTCSGDPTSWSNWQLHSTLSSNMNVSSDRCRLKLFSDPDIGDTVLLFYMGIFTTACGVYYLTSENTWSRIFSTNYLSDVTFDENGKIYFSVVSGTYNETIKIYRVDSTTTLTLVVDITLSSTVQGTNVRSFTFRHTIYSKFDRCFYAEVGNIIIGIPLDNPTNYTSYLSSYAPTSSNEKKLKLIGNENCPYFYAFLPKSSDKTLYAGIATLRGATLIYEGESSTINSLTEKSDCSFSLYLNNSVCLAILTLFSRDGLNFLKSHRERTNGAMVGWSGYSSLTLQTEDTMYLVLNGVLYKSNFDTCMQ